MNCDEWSDERRLTVLSEDSAPASVGVARQRAKVARRHEFALEGVVARAAGSGDVRCEHGRQLVPRAVETVRREEL